VSERPDDRALLEAWRDGDRRAGRRLVERHLAGLGRFLRAAWTRIDALEDRKPHQQVQRVRAGLALARTLAAIDADDPEIATLAAAALAALPTEHSTPSLVRMRDSLVALSE
jgi:hypothetical protein